MILFFYNQYHHYPLQVVSMLAHRVLLSATPVGPIPTRVPVFAGKGKESVTGARTRQVSSLRPGSTFPAE
jgi:hypothetical protein